MPRRRLDSMNHNKLRNVCYVSIRTKIVNLVEGLHTTMRARLPTILHGHP